MLNREAANAVRNELKAAAEPVRATAQRLASVQISNIGPVWSGMKLGTTMRGVYVAPSSRRGGGSPRPTLGRLLLSRAMLPAVDQHPDEIVGRVEDALDRLGDRVGF